MILYILMHSQTQTGAEIQSTERVLRVEHPSSDHNNAERVHEGSELSNVTERRERVLRCGDDNRGFAPPTTSGLLGKAGEAPIENRIDSSPRHVANTVVGSFFVFTLPLLLPQRHEQEYFSCVPKGYRTRIIFPSSSLSPNIWKEGIIKGINARICVR